MVKYLLLFCFVVKSLSSVRELDFSQYFIERELKGSLSDRVCVQSFQLLTSS